MSKLIRLAALAAASSLVAATPDAAPVRLTTQALAEPSFLSGPQLSPDGQRLLARVVANGTVALGVAELAGNGLETVPIPEEDELRSYSWAGNRRILLSVGARIPWYDRGERYVTRAFVYDLDSHKALPLGPKVQGLRGDDILWVDPDGKELLMSAQLDQFSYPSLFRVDLANGKSRLEQGPRDYVWDWYADLKGAVRYGVGVREHSWFAFYRNAHGDLDSQPPQDYDAEATVDALRLTPGSDEGYALSPRGSGRYALYRYNFATRKFGDKLYESPTNDLAETIVDPTTGKLLGVRFTDDRERVAWLDPDMKAVQAKLDGTFRGRSVAIQSRSRDNSRMIVRVSATTDPGAYYLYMPATGQLSRLARIADKVDRAGLSETKYVHYTARDGLEIPAYLTLPAGRPAKDLPLVIVPHGGPYGVRDTLEYDNEVQFLANRGYAVLQPNYRGSEGYGHAFYEKGEGQWGRSMQDDVDDGMDWLVKSGTADAKRVCIVGGSYGGYVALWGVTRNPERYRCAVSFAGVSDMRAQLDYQSDFLVGTRWRKDWQTTVKGQRSFDLASISPLTKAAELKVPVMLVHGDADRTVPLRQTTAYDKALTAAGKPHETYIYPGEGHGFTKAEDEKDYLDKLEAFLTKHNPA